MYPPPYLTAINNFESMSLTGKWTFSPHVETRGIVTPSSKSTSICLGNPNGGILSTPVKK